MSDDQGENREHPGTVLKNGERDARIIALHLQGLSLREIGAQVGCSPQTAMRVIARADIPGRDEATLKAAIEAQAKVLAERALMVAGEALDRLAEKLQDAKPVEAATAFGILIDKAQVLRGEPSVVQEQRSNVAAPRTLEEARAIAEELRRKAAILEEPREEPKPDSVN